MSGSEFVRGLLTERRNRMVGGLMRHIEAEVYPHLPPDKRKALRDRVLGDVGSYHDVVLDIVKASVNDGSVLNQKAVELLDAIHADIKIVKKRG